MPGVTGRRAQNGGVRERLSLDTVTFLAVVRGRCSRSSLNAGTYLDVLIWLGNSRRSGGKQHGQTGHCDSAAERQHRRSAPDRESRGHGSSCMLLRGKRSVIVVTG